MAGSYKIQIIRITWIGLGVNLLLSLFKFIVGIIGNSQVVIADAVHSLSDMTTDIAIIFGVRFWSSPPDKCHPYGHSRIETLVTLGISFSLIIVALGIGYRSLDCVRSVFIAQPGWIAVAGPIASMILKEALYWWTISIGKRLRSPSLIANAWHHRSDAMSSLLALIAVCAAAIDPGWAFVDRVGAIIVSLMILQAAWRIAKPAMAEIMERGASEKEIKAIDQIARDVDGVRDVHAIRTRRLGASLYVDLHIALPPEMSVRSGHTIAESVKNQLIKTGPNVIDVVVHMEPHG